MITSPETEDVDILVFPEGCINDVTYPVPITHRETLPCHDEQAASLIRNVSCAARKARTYVVIDVMMKEACSIPCSDDRNFVIYNTAVVFDRNGVIVAK